VSFSSEGSDDPDGDDLTYEWNFGDGTPVSNDANPTHTFTEPGQYTVRLLVTDTTGKSGTSTLVVTAGKRAR
jgi:cytochrome c